MSNWIRPVTPGIISNTIQYRYVTLATVWISNIDRWSNCLVFRIEPFIADVQVSHFSIDNKYESLSFWKLLNISLFVLTLYTLCSSRNLAMFLLFFANSISHVSIFDSGMMSTWEVWKLHLQLMKVTGSNNILSVC